MRIKCIQLATQYFLQQRGGQLASSLSYSTLLSVVPITAFILYMLLQNEDYSPILHQIINQILHQLLPTGNKQIEAYLLHTAQGVTSFSFISMGIIFFSAIWLSLGVERAINHIWHVQTPRSLKLRVPAHIILWLFSPPLILASITASMWITSLPYLHNFESEISLLSRMLPGAMTFFSLFLLYYIVPNTKVYLKHAFLASLASTMLFELSKWLFTIYITQYAMYEKLYGALATLPIFMLWILISWVIVLWGASLSFVLQQDNL